jgi:SAM-dependent methyltransferase
VAARSTDSIAKILKSWWVEQARESGAARATSLLLKNFCVFLRDSTPQRRRSRYGDVEYDWAHRVNTTSGTVSSRARLLGLFHSPYQPTDAASFREMMSSLPIAFEQFTFLDLGSGKGRTLLMASDYGFRKIIGVELIAELHQAAAQNVREYRSQTQRCHKIESVLADARDYEFPDGPLVLYLFNPLPERALIQVLDRLDRSIKKSPRPLRIIYHNPLLEKALASSHLLKRTAGTEQYSIYAYNHSTSAPSAADRK